MKQADPARSQRRRRKNRSRPTPKWLLQGGGHAGRSEGEVPDGAGRAVGGEAGDGCDRSGGDLAWDVLPARDAGDHGDAESPGAGAPREENGAPSSRRIGELEEKVKTLEQGRRRTERLLLLTRKVVKGGVTLKSKRTASTGAGRSPLRSSRKQKAGLSILTPAGEGEP